MSSKIYWKTGLQRAEGRTQTKGGDCSSTIDEGRHITRTNKSAMDRLAMKTPVEERDSSLSFQTTVTTSKLPMVPNRRVKQKQVVKRVLVNGGKWASDSSAKDPLKMFTELSTSRTALSLPLNWNWVIIGVNSLKLGNSWQISNLEFSKFAIC